ncbi:hypothetical protein H5410_039145 [Solanum commersonii]|uniref:Uncharacterized protein n=1 Tax=Solanum commersonii TaxID=4109 RepID=A0A9J5YC75_SOLCO|nr:hypothetical protein H5410_039145 [Solanum commersonii]
MARDEINMDIGGRGYGGGSQSRIWIYDVILFMLGFCIIDDLIAIKRMYAKEARTHKEVGTKGTP